MTPLSPRSRATLRAGALSLTLTFAPLALPASAIPDLESASVAMIGPNTFENRVLRQINKRREARNLRRVRIVDPCLDRFAEDWASTLAATGELVHRDQTVIVTTCDLTWAGETLARGHGLTPRRTVVAWMKSPTHKAVIMKRRANRAGVGVRYDSEDRAVVVLNFGDAN